MTRIEPVPASTRNDLQKRVLVLVAGKHEREVTLEVLSKEGIAAAACRDVEDLLQQMQYGATAALIAEEVLSQDAIDELAAWIAAQPAWSDFPLIVFSVAENTRLRRSEVLSNVTFLERPVRLRSMLAAVRAAIRSRARQFESRRAIESRDSFLAMLGHELRNPLGAISLAGILLGRRWPTPQPPRELEVVARQAAHLTRLVDDLLDVARITHGKVRLSKELLSLHDVALAAFETQQQRAREHLSSYDFEEVESGLYVEADRQRLEQVLTNLLTNAIKYTPPGGRVMLRLRAEPGVAVIEVLDTGVGLEGAALSSVFEPFNQVDASLDRAQGGIGLGLALVANIVQMHSGSVEAHSDGLGRGACFSVRLPRKAQPSVAYDGSGGAEHAYHPRRVVVVEDNADLRELLSALLSQAGHHVYTAEDGPHGLERILTLAPDLAFVDLGLPGFDGYEVARRARAAGSRSSLVALTGYGRKEDKRQSRLAGFDTHLVKPIVEADLTRMLAECPRHLSAARSA